MREFLSPLEKRKINLEFKIAETFLRCQESPNIILDSSFIGPISIFSRRKTFFMGKEFLLFVQFFCDKKKKRYQCRGGSYGMRCQ